MLTNSKNISVGQKINLINVFLLGSLFVLGAIGYWEVFSLHKRQNAIVNQLSAVRNITLMDMWHDGFYAVVMRSLLAVERQNFSEKNEIIAEVKDFTDRANTNLSEVEKVSLTPKTTELFKKVKPTFNSYIVESKQIVNLALAGKKQESLAEFANFKKLFQQLEVELDELGKQVERDAQNIQEISEQKAKLAEIIAILAMVGALVLGFVLSFFRDRLITGSLKQAISVITSSSTEIATTVEQQERTVSQQAASVQQTTITMEELGASSRQAAEQAEVSASGARQALAIAENGSQAVRETMDGMNKLRDNVRAIAEQIIRLSEQSGQIANISDLVADIANQTNMLALNAAVEAARAGEQGKGFGVVATEIRKLADESKKSAEKINTLVQDLQASMNSTVMVTDEGSKKTEASIQLAQGTALAFSGVTDAINNVFVNSQQISLSAKQQAVAVQQVIAAMNAINLGAQETSTGINQVRVTTEQLEEAAKSLQEVV